MPSDDDGYYNQDIYRPTRPTRVPHRNYSVNVATTASGDSYYCTVVKPDGMTASCRRDTLADVWAFAERTIKET